MAIRRLIPLILLLALSCAYFNTFYNAEKYFKEAEKLYEERGATNPEVTKKYRKVIEKCSKVLDRYPESRYIDDALYLMAIAYMRLGEKQKAKRKFGELFTFYPNTKYRDRALLDYASLLISLGEYDSARSVIKGIRKKSRPDIQIILARLAFKEGNYNAVIKMGREFLKKKRLDERSREFLNLAADAAIKIDSLDAAQAFLSTLGKLDLSPKDRFKVSILYLDFLYKRQQPDTALSIISSLRYSPESNESRLLALYKARFLLLKGDTLRAQNTLRELLKARRSDSIRVIATYELARVFEEHDDLSTADSLYKTIMYSSYTPVAKKARERENVMKDIITLRDSTDCTSISRIAELYLFELGRVQSAKKKYNEVFKKCSGIAKQRAMYALLYISLSEGDTISARDIINQYPCDSIPDSLKKMIKEGLNFEILCQKADTLR